ncbi:MAG: glycosyltransferase [Anaerolineae bacterium]
MSQDILEPNILVVIPTASEQTQLELLVNLVLQQQTNLHILLVSGRAGDDKERVSDMLASRDERIQLLRSPKRLSYADACKLGFEYALRYAYPYVLTMQADFSHNPLYIPQLVTMARSFDLAIGSRYFNGGGTIGARLIPAWLEKQTNAAIRRLTGLPVSDCLTRFACYQTFILPHIHYATLRTRGSGFEVDILERCTRSGFRIGELPVYYDCRQLSGTRDSMFPLIAGLTAAAYNRFAHPGNKHTIQAPLIRIE